MQNYYATIAAGATVTMAVPGRLFQIIGGSSLDVDLLLAGRAVAQGVNVKVGLRVEPDGGLFDSIRIKNNGASLQVVEFFATMGNAGYEQPVAGLTLSGTVDTRDVKDTTLSHLAAVTVGTVATLIAGADATRRGLRIYNNGAADIWLGAAGVTTANGAMRVPPYNYVDETQAPAAAWYAISGTAGQNVRVMEVR